MSLDGLKNAVRASRNLVCLLGRGVSLDTGCDAYGGGEFAYVVEQKYGSSPEEIFSSSCLNTRPRKFFEYYRAQILEKRGQPNACHDVLARLEQEGKLRAIITRGIFGLAKRGGCRNVISLHGTIYDNYCTHCGEKYSIDYMMKGNPIPFCEKCGAIVRPGIVLGGEMLDNNKVTEAARFISEADTLLVLGSRLNDDLCIYGRRYFAGKYLILIHDTPHYLDEMASYCCIGQPKDILPQLYP